MLLIQVSDEVALHTSSAIDSRDIYAVEKTLAGNKIFSRVNFQRMNVRIGISTRGEQPRSISTEEAVVDCSMFQMFYQFFNSATEVATVQATKFRPSKYRSYIFHHFNLESLCKINLYAPFSQNLNFNLLFLPELRTHLVLISSIYVQLRSFNQKELMKRTGRRNSLLYLQWSSYALF